ncbi:MAG: glycosyltransferase family 1 protein [Nitrospirae bacterium]|nr:MAG: glycosyltransferase family 1 protein [Nitrospirota bacterium]
MSLIGVYTESRARIVEALCGVPGLRIWGPGWEQFLAGREGRDPQAFRGQGLSPADACKVYNASLVNLNTHHHQSRDAGVNTRAFEILAAGAFELTDHVPGMEAFLDPGREVAVYRTSEEATELARYYAKADEERRRLAGAGHKRVLAEHTYRHRMQTLLDAVVR